MGHSVAEWKRLEADLRSQNLVLDFSLEKDSGYGKRFEIVAELRGPNGGSVQMRSVWQIDEGTEDPRLITLYPE